MSKNTLSSSDRLYLPAAVIRFFLLAGLLTLASCASTPQPTLAIRQTDALSTLGFNKVEDGWKLILPDRVLFDFDKTNLKPELRRSLVDTAHQLLAVDIHQLRVEGHTDNVGKREYNQYLSLRRANSVADALVAEGFAQTDVATKGYGSDRPTASNETEEERAENRRVEIIVLTNVLSQP